MSRLSFVAALLVVVLALPARASQNSGNSSGNSANSSGQSGGSSADSGNSSGQSAEGSQASSGASETSGGTSQQSADSSNQSSAGTGDALVVGLAVTGVLAVVGLTTYMVSAVISTAHAAQAQAQLHRFLRERHAQVALAVMHAEGELLDAWTATLQLSPEERRRFSVELEGSEEQTAMLRALDGLESVDDVRAFSLAFARTLERVVGRDRVLQLVHEAAQG